MERAALENGKNRTLPDEDTEVGAHASVRNADVAGEELDLLDGRDVRKRWQLLLSRNDDTILRYNNNKNQNGAPGIVGRGRRGRRKQRPKCSQNMKNNF